MKIYIKIALIAIVVKLSPALASEGLSMEQLKKLNNNELILFKEKIKSESWPKLKILLKINSTPLEAVAIYLALDHQRNYLPGLLKSRPVKYINPKNIHTAYEMNLPWPMGTSKYTHGSILSKSGSTYKVNFYMVKSDSTEKVKGSAVFKSFSGGTLMVYESHIRPKSALASFVKGVMVFDTKKSMIAIKNEVERAKKSDKDLLKKYIQKINDSLQLKKSYQLSK